MSILTQHGFFYTTEEMEDISSTDLQSLLSYYKSQIALQNRLFELDLSESEGGRTASAINSLKKQCKLISRELADRPSHGA